MAAAAPCIALLEDIDATFDGRKGMGKHLTFDCLLNCIDGAERIEGVFVILTTNDFSKVDAALGGGGQTRPGRVDRVFELPLLNKEGQRQLAARILEEWPEAPRQRSTSRRQFSRCSRLKTKPRPSIT